MSALDIVLPASSSQGASLPMPGPPVKVSMFRKLAKLVVTVRSELDLTSKRHG